jgi:hypothetical protein
LKASLKGAMEDLSPSIYILCPRDALFIFFFFSLSSASSSSSSFYHEDSNGPSRCYIAGVDVRQQQ